MRARRHQDSFPTFKVINCEGDVKVEIERGEVHKPETLGEVFDNERGVLRATWRIRIGVVESHPWYEKFAAKIGLSDFSATHDRGRWWFARTITEATYDAAEFDALQYAGLFSDAIQKEPKPMTDGIATTARE